VKASPRATQKSIFIFRLVVAILLTGYSTFQLVVYQESTFLYLTEWGVYSTTFWFDFMVLCHLFLASPQEIEQNPKSPFRLFKWAIVWFEVALTLEFVIVTVFWGVLLPYYFIVIRGDADALAALDMEATPDNIATNVIDHSFCLLCLCIDWVINCI